MPTMLQVVDSLWRRVRARIYEIKPDFLLALVETGKDFSSNWHLVEK